jgi:hypothetical protein
MTKTKARTTILVLSIVLATLLAAAVRQLRRPPSPPPPRRRAPGADPTGAGQPTAGYPGAGTHTGAGQPTAEPAAEEPAEKVGTMAVSFTINQRPQPGRLD